MHAEFSYAAEHQNIRAPVTKQPYTTAVQTDHIQTMIPLCNFVVGSSCSDTPIQQSVNTSEPFCKSPFNLHAKHTLAFLGKNSAHQILVDWLPKEAVAKMKLKKKLKRNVDTPKII